jgi:hypothetical protein
MTSRSYAPAGACLAERTQFSSQGGFAAGVDAAGWSFTAARTMCANDLFFSIYTF